MNGKTRTTSSPCLNAEAIRRVVEALRAAPETLCLTTSDRVATDLKKAFGETEKLPPILSLHRLLAVIRRDPNLSLAECLTVATAAAVADESPLRLTWRIHGLLAEHNPGGLFPAARWQLAGQLAVLFADIDEARPIVGNNPFKAFLGESLSYEAGLAAALWDLLVGENLVLPRQRAMWRLADLLEDRPVIVAAEETITAVEEDFCRHYPQFNFESVAAEQSLIDFFSSPSASLADDRIVLCRQGSGHTLSETASLALQDIHRFLVGRESDGARMGIVVHNRLLARRLRAMAEGDGILIGDAIGWRVETLSYGAALGLFAEAVAGDFSLPRITELLQPPFFAGRQSLSNLDKHWRRWLAETPDIPTNSDELSRQSFADNPQLAGFAAEWCRLQRSAPESAPLTEWVDWLLAQSDEALAAWRDDAVAVVWRNTLRNFARDCAEADARRADAKEFLLWFAETLASHSLADQSVDSPILFVPPTTGQTFDALLLLDYVESPTVDDRGWLGERERRSLGLPGRKERMEADCRRFARLLATHTSVTAIWQSLADDGEEQNPHPYWRLYAAAARRAGKLDELTARTSEALSDEVSPPLPAQARALRLPDSLSLSRGRELMACPYRYYLDNFLRLDERPDVDELLPSPKMLGSLLHTVLSEFSGATQHSRSREALEIAWATLLDKHVASVRRPTMKLNALHWRLTGQAFLDWELEQRENGWHTHKTEFRIQAEWEGTHLNGRIDRLDCHDDSGEWRIIDYKKGGLPAKATLASGEDPQLSVYAWLYSALYDGLTVADKRLLRPVTDDRLSVVDEADSRRVAIRLRSALKQIKRGAPLPANGAAATCAVCWAAGICRRPHWRQG